VLITTAVKAGVTLLDTAEMYGNEELIGRVVALHWKQAVLCSKFGGYWGASVRPDECASRRPPHQPGQPVLVDEDVFSCAGRAERRSLACASRCV
jgi:aryl-alcohol dehydrogenase-like predicted oxidoreductase